MDRRYLGDILFHKFRCQFLRLNLSNATYYLNLVWVFAHDEQDVLDNIQHSKKIFYNYLKTK